VQVQPTSPTSRNTDAGDPLPAPTRVGKRGADAVNGQRQRKADGTDIADERQQVLGLWGAGDKVEPLVRQHHARSRPLAHVGLVQQRSLADSVGDMRPEARDQCRLRGGEAVRAVFPVQHR